MKNLLIESWAKRIDEDVDSIISEEEEVVSFKEEQELAHILASKVNGGQMLAAWGPDGIVAELQNKNYEDLRNGDLKGVAWITDKKAYAISEDFLDNHGIKIDELKNAFNDSNSWRFGYDPDIRVVFIELKRHTTPNLPESMKQDPAVYEGEVDGTQIEDTENYEKGAPNFTIHIELNDGKTRDIHFTEVKAATDQFISLVENNPETYKRIKHLTLIDNKNNEVQIKKHYTNADDNGATPPDGFYS